MNKAKYLKNKNREYTSVLQRIDSAEWPPMPLLAPEKMLVEVWRSSRFMVQIYMDNGYERLSVLRTELSPAGMWRDGISWDELQRLKAQAGRGDHWAVEIFPPAAEVVNVANMRHLFLLKEAPPLWMEN